MNLTTTLTTEIIEHHDNLISNLKRSVTEAILAGEGINRMKKLLKHGEFLNWIEKELPFSEDTAERYVNLYLHQEKIRTVRNLTEAYQIVDKVTQEKTQAKQNTIGERIEEAERTGFKPTEWDNDTEKEYKKRKHDEGIEKRKKETFKEPEPPPDPLRTLFEKIMEESSQEAELDLNTVKDSVKQRGIFTVLEEYIESFKTVSEKLETTHNLIKKLRLIAIKYQQKSI